MKLGLGIDTGGTYTDAVIYDFDTAAVQCRAKSLTTKEDLLLGINAVLDALNADQLARIGLVSLSTTLATNACVEGRGRRAKLILIGCDPAVARKYGTEYGLPNAEDILFLPGGHDLHGAVTAEPDWSLLKNHVRACCGSVDAFAVVELWGIANPEYEKEAQSIITELSAKPVVCGHEITNAVNSLRRAASALLNAQLVGIISEFLDAVHLSLDQRGIRVPVAIVKSDGTMMSDAYARSHPVETLLCGPAASVCGGMFLTHRDDCIVVDMGGTTTDIALVREASPLMTQKGANIGGWKTGIRSIDITTAGLGGDSIIRYDEYFRLSVGPTKATPLCCAAARWPEVAREIVRIHAAKKKHTVSLCEFFYAIRPLPAAETYSESERELHAALQQPLGIEQLSGRCNITIYEAQRRVERLERHGVLMRCALTPTDVMHAEGQFNAFDREAAQAGVEIMALQLGISARELCKKVREMVECGIYRHVVHKLLALEMPETFADGIGAQTDAVIESAFYKSLEPCGQLLPAFRSPYPLVGLGAPIHVYLPTVAKALGCECLVDADAGVANAIGAVTGNVAVRESVTVTAEFSTAGIVAYNCAGSLSAARFSNYEDAVAWAEEQALEAAKKTATAQGAIEVELRLERREKRFSIAPRLLDDSTDAPSVPVEEPEEEVEEPLLETVITAVGNGKVDCVLIFGDSADSAVLDFRLYLFIKRA
ncbi:MAG: hydantoinase/oxoprolinase family protein [Clostridia bacterium]|nr:hydantoinase/oxoprolinase family protein [Clostridia bacterium]